MRPVVGAEAGTAGKGLEMKSDVARVASKSSQRAESPPLHFKSFSRVQLRRSWIFMKRILVILEYAAS
jgi:hypothetical protein